MHFAREKMHAHGAGGGEVDARSPRGNLRVGKQNSSAKINVRYDPAVRIEIPYHGEGIYRGPVRGIRRLKKRKDWDGVESVLESSAKKARPVRLGDDPAVAKAGSPDAGVLRDSMRPVPSRRPQFDFISTRLRRVLRARGRGKSSAKQAAGKEQHADSLHSRNYPHPKCIAHKVGKRYRNARKYSIAALVGQPLLAVLLPASQSLANAKADSQEWLSHNVAKRFLQADVFFVRSGGSITS